MLNRDDIIGILSGIQEDLENSQKELCDNLINIFYDAGIGEQALPYIQEHLENLYAENEYLFQEIFRLIDNIKETH